MNQNPPRRSADRGSLYNARLPSIRGKDYARGRGRRFNTTAPTKTSKTRLSGFKARPCFAREIALGDVVKHPTRGLQQVCFQRVGVGHRLAQTETALRQRRRAPR